MNKYIKVSCPIFFPTYVKLFNWILDSVHITESWIVGIIKPLNKSKGDPTFPENYRPITILSCMGKLFTILNSRLNNYLEEDKLLNETLAGFRSSYSTADNKFNWILEGRKTKLYCAFIDFQKAFGSVWGLDYG